jgi:nicotinate-nucleotide adenylyltransferase
MAKPVILFTGSFNPPTIAHRQVLERLQQQLPDIPIVVLPAARTVHKDPASLAPFDDRMAMARLMANGLRGVTVSDIAATVPSAETAPLLSALRTQVGNSHTILAMGADVFATLPQWQDWQTLAANNSFYVLARHPDAIDGFTMPTPQVESAAALINQSCWYGDAEFVATASASAVRAGTGADYLTADVCEYISMCGLYR